MDDDIVGYQEFHRIDLLCGFKWNLDWLQENDTVEDDAEEYVTNE